jgi:ATP-binding cassette subfamily B protein
VVDCDHIYVFDDGRITESGTHHELMELGGEYAQMFALQAAAYQAEASTAGPAVRCAMSTLDAQ